MTISNRNRVRRLPGVALAAALLLAGATTGQAGPQENGAEKGTAAEVKKEAAETYEAWKQYTLEQREEAMTAAKNKLRELDSRIDELQESLEEGWQDMSEATRRKTRESLNALRQKREEVAEWYGGMRHSSAEAWEEVKKGFADSFDRLEEAFKRARKDFANKE
jgi:chromosome segregation ATPase